jgi:two-component system NarL family sensor kinase
MLSTETGIYYTFFAGLSVLVIMVVFFLILVFKAQKRRFKEVKGQVLKDMSLIEEERKRISIDLHDDIGSTLASVRMDLENLLTEMPGNFRINKTIVHVENTRQRVRLIAHNLMPGILLSWGLCAAIQDLAEEAESAKNIKVHFNSNCDDKKFDPAKSIMVFRVIQEIVSNALKHSLASQIVITCSGRAQIFTLEIRDNGKGFDLKNYNLSGKHLGLQNIQTRLGLLSAEYTIHSSPQEGTRYNIQIPLNIMN